CSRPILSWVLISPVLASLDLLAYPSRESPKQGHAMNRRLIVLLVIGIGVLFGLTGCTFTNPAFLGPPCDSNAPRCGDDCCMPPNMCVDGKCKGPLIALKRAPQLVSRLRSVSTVSACSV